MNIAERTIVSSQDAIISAKQLARNGSNLGLMPCDGKDGELPYCRFKDPKLGTLCKHPDGLLAEKNAVSCPLQKGSLQIVSKTAEK